MQHEKDSYIWKTKEADFHLEICLSYKKGSLDDVMKLRMH